MNQGRIWCVVHPTVGLPLLLGGVAVTSLIVHASVMQHTSWMSNYWQGAARVKTSENASPTAQPAFAISVAPVAAAGGTETSFVVTVTPNPAAKTLGDAAPTVAKLASAAPAGLDAGNVPSQ